MEQQDLELVSAHLAHDEELKALWEEHVGYEKILERYAGKAALSPAEELDVKEYKKKKLAGKTKIQSLLEKYRKEA